MQYAKTTAAIDGAKNVLPPLSLVTIPWEKLIRLYGYPFFEKKSSGQLGKHSLSHSLVTGSWMDVEGNELLIETLLPGSLQESPARVRFYKYLTVWTCKI